jgi:hypothetical protein
LLESAFSAQASARSTKNRLSASNRPRRGDRVAYDSLIFGNAIGEGCGAMCRRSRIGRGAQVKPERRVGLKERNQPIERARPDERTMVPPASWNWSPPNVNRNFMQLTAGLRFNEPLPLGFHNTMSLGYVRNSLSSEFLPPGVAAWKTGR